MKQLASEEVCAVMNLNGLSGDSKLPRALKIELFLILNRWPPMTQQNSLSVLSHMIDSPLERIQLFYVTVRTINPQVSKGRRLIASNGYQKQRLAWKTLPQSKLLN
jgi:hypothetical protein